MQRDDWRHPRQRPIPGKIYGADPHNRENNHIISFVTKYGPSQRPLSLWYKIFETQTDLYKRWKDRPKFLKHSDFTNERYSEAAGILKLWPNKHTIEVHEFEEEYPELKVNAILTL